MQEFQVGQFRCVRCRLVVTADPGTDLGTLPVIRTADGALERTGACVLCSAAAVHDSLEELFDAVFTAEANWRFDDRLDLGEKQ